MIESNPSSISSGWIPQRRNNPATAELMAEPVMSGHKETVSFCASSCLWSTDTDLCYQSKIRNFCFPTNSVLLPPNCHQHWHQPSLVSESPNHIIYCNVFPLSATTIRQMTGGSALNRPHCKIITPYAASSLLLFAVGVFRPMCIDNSYISRLSPYLKYTYGKRKCVSGLSILISAPFRL
jgi:hypothetical protein